jgi:hypothetical protein
MDKLSSAIKNLPQTKNPSLPVSASFFAAVFQQANLQVNDIPQKRKLEKEEEEESNNNNNIPQKKAKLQKEDNNKPKQKRKEKYLPFLK